MDEPKPEGAMVTAIAMGSDTCSILGLVTAKKTCLNKARPEPGKLDKIAKN